MIDHIFSPYFYIVGKFIERKKEEEDNFSY